MLDYFNKSEMLQTIVRRADAEIRTEYGKNGLDLLFLTPPACNVLNKTGGFLARKLFDRWLDAFFNGFEITLISKRTDVHDVMQRGCSESFVQFSYKK